MTPSVNVDVNDAACMPSHVLVVVDTAGDDGVGEDHQTIYTVGVYAEAGAAVVHDSFVAAIHVGGARAHDGGGAAAPGSERLLVTLPRRPVIELGDTAVMLFRWSAGAMAPNLAPPPDSP